MVITIRICIIGLKKICLFLDIQEEEMDPELSLFSLLNTESRLNELIVRINNWVHQYHLVFDQPLAGTYWEEILSKSFADIGHETTWTPNNSHKVGEDFKISNLIGSSISCKSGVFKHNKTHNLGKCVEFSSSRTISHKTLEEKLEHLNSHNYDYHFMLSKHMKFDKTYELLIIGSEMCKVLDLTWEANKNGKKGDFVSVSGPFKATITESMSGQLWITLPLDRVMSRRTIGLK